MSEFRRLVRRRMERTNAQWGDNVPWELDDKYAAYDFVRSLGWKTPATRKCTSAAEALAAGREFGSRFVVKQPNLHSSRGVWVLERIGEDRYLDLLTCRIVAGSSIKAQKAEPDYWLAEELLDSTCRGAVIPFDYKVYAFRGLVTHVLQMDRSIWPVRVAAFDGTFLPLQIGRDIQVNPGGYRPQGHVIPLHAAGIVAMASELSRALDTSFVRVDCYDTPHGPIFGEFTFTPGSEDVGTIRYSGAVEETLDGALAGEVTAPLSGLDIDYESFRESVRRHQGPIFTAEREMLSLIAATAVQADRRYAQRIAHLTCGGALGEHFALGARMVGLHNGDLQQASLIRDAIEMKTGFLTGNGRAGEYASIALKYDDMRRKTLSGNPGQ